MVLPGFYDSIGFADPGWLGQPHGYPFVCAGIDRLYDLHGFLGFPAVNKK